MERGILMKSEKVTQILLLTTGLAFFLVGIFRGEAAAVLSNTYGHYDAGNGWIGSHQKNT